MASGYRFSPYSTAGHHNPLFDDPPNPGSSFPLTATDPALLSFPSAAGPIRNGQGLRAADLARFNHQPVAQPSPDDEQASESGSFDWDKRFGHLPPASEWGDEEPNQQPNASTPVPAPLPREPTPPPATPRQSTSASQPTPTPASASAIRPPTATGTPRAPRSRAPAPARPAYVQAPDALVRSFTSASTQAGLDDHHRAIGFRMIDAKSSEDPYVGELVVKLEVLQQFNTKLDRLLGRMEQAEEQQKKQALDLQAKEDLKSFLYAAAVRFITTSTIDAYTAHENANGPIPRALFNLLLKKVLKASASWRHKVLGPKYVYEAKPDDLVHKTILSISKNVRSSIVTKALLHTGLPAHSNGTADTPVPHEDTMIFQMRGKLKTHPDGSYFNREEVNEDTDHATRGRLVCLRLLFCEYQMYRGRFNGLTNWGAVEAMVNDLNRESARYRLCFASLAIEDDIARFTGDRTMVQVKQWMAANNVSWGLPSRERVAVMMAALEVKLGDRPHPLETLYQGPMTAVTPADPIGQVVSQALV